jgi:hypothetical protein
MPFEITITTDAEAHLRSLPARDQRNLEAAILARLVDQATATTKEATTRPSTTQSVADAAASEAKAVLIAYMDASLKQDREALKSLVLLPTDPKRRKWVLGVIEKVELPPSGVKRISESVNIDGSVAVCEVMLEMPDGSRDTSPASFLVRRDAQWKVVIDYFQGATSPPKSRRSSNATCAAGESIRAFVGHWCLGIDLPPARGKSSDLPADEMTKSQ